VRKALLGAYSYAEFGAVMLGVLPFIAVSNLRHKDPRYPGRWLRRIGRWSSNLSPLWNFKIEGELPRDIKERGYVVIANHESTADPFLLSHLPFDMRWIAKQELFKPPVVGWTMRLSRDIPLKRGDGNSIRKMMEACKASIEAGLSIMIFPEGTRSKDASLLPFRDGAFQLAIDTGAPILPIAIHGTHACRPKGSKWFGEASAVAHVLAPIETSTLSDSDLPQIRDIARANIQQAVNELRKRPELGKRF
jgi:1-acyl-sn-glycerol-3-phosphate acyltransferase